MADEKNTKKIDAKKANVFTLFEKIKASNLEIFELSTQQFLCFLLLAKLAYAFFLSKATYNPEDYITNTSSKLSTNILEN